MKTIKIEGEFGWDIFAKDIRNQFDESKGQDVRLEISSIGGSVWEALGVFNAIRDHNAKVFAQIKDIAASAAAYILSAVDSENIEIYDNSVFMIHNPWHIMVGDYRDAKREAEFLEGITEMMAKGFANATGKSVTEIRSLLDNETWLFGDEIIDSGFAGSLVKSDDTTKSKDSIILESKLAFNTCIAKMQSDQTMMQDYKNKILDFMKTAQNYVHPINTTKQEKKEMNKKELMEKYPDLYTEIYNMGKNDEKDRVSAHLNFVKAGIAVDHAIEAIEKDKLFNASEQSFYQVEGLKNHAIKDREDDNPDPIPGTSNDDIDAQPENKQADLLNLVMERSTIKAKK